MKKLSNIFLLLLTIGGIGFLTIKALSKFNETDSKPKPNPSIKEEIIDITKFPEEGFYLEFTKDWPDGLFSKSNGYSNGGIYNCTWDNRVSRIENNHLLLTLIAEKEQWLCPEIVSNINFSYGYYEAAIKTTNVAGTVTFFGTYSPNGDEIDIEFNGGALSTVELNYWSEGKNSKGKIIKLDFNTAEDYHVYAFDWQPDSLKFYADNDLLWETAYQETKVPVSSPSAIIMSLWPGTKDLNKWLGDYLDPANPPEKNIESSFEWIKFTPYKKSATS